VRGRIRVARSVAPVTLGDRPAAALAMLLPLLGCGEEAAALAFDGLADHHRPAPDIAAGLDRIAREERVHEALIAQLCDDLPFAGPPPRLLGEARRFHITLQQGGVGQHLARIAALDAAVCTLLSRLLRPGGPIATDQTASRILGRIRHDEAGHVRLSRRLALDFGPDVTDAAAEAREKLADILGLAADAFEDLGVDPAALDRDIRRLPDGLLSA
jgi:hypothetical protein